MKKYIHVTKEVRQELAKVFKVGDRTVRNALLFPDFVIASPKNLRQRV